MTEQIGPNTRVFHLHQTRIGWLVLLQVLVVVVVHVHHGSCRVVIQGHGILVRVVHCSRLFLGFHRRLVQNGRPRFVVSPMGIRVVVALRVVVIVRRGTNHHALVPQSMQGLGRPFSQDGIRQVPELQLTRMGRYGRGLLNGVSQLADPLIRGMLQGTATGVEDGQLLVIPKGRIQGSTGVVRNVTGRQGQGMQVPSLGQKTPQGIALTTQIGMIQDQAFQGCTHGVKAGQDGTRQGGV